MCDWIARSPQTIRNLNGFEGIRSQIDVESINFYTALPIVDATIVGYEGVQKKVDRHQIYIQACQAEGINVQLGRFKRRDQTCRVCSYVRPGYEEKETDVHIAVDVVCKALSGKIDIAYVLTGDSDIGPAFDCVRSETNVKLITVAFEPRAHSKELLSKSHGQMYIRRSQLEKNLLPSSILNPDTGYPIARPLKYTPKI